MKRALDTYQGHDATKKARSDHNDRCHPTQLLLQQFYPVVSTLRQYLASKLWHTSIRRSRRLQAYGIKTNADAWPDVDQDVLSLLDNIIIGSFDKADAPSSEPFEEEISIFTQQLTGSTAADVLSQRALEQSEIVEFTIWLLSRRCSTSLRKSHVLTMGLQRQTVISGGGSAVMTAYGNSGIIANRRNRQAQILTQHPWNSLPHVVGRGAERIISDLLLHCGVFQPVENSSNLSQLSGVPLSDLRPLSNQSKEEAAPAPGSDKPMGFLNGNIKISERKAGEIRFMRHRMLYARPMMGSKNRVHFSLNFNHVLNRLRDLKSIEETIHVMRYIFPRQFRLHNVFTSEINLRDTGQPFRDYTDREGEIAAVDRRWRRQLLMAGRTSDNQRPLPKRLRGTAVELVGRIRKRHSTCAYGAMIEHYCPASIKLNTDCVGSIAHATSLARVSAFCKAVIRKVFPVDLWGFGATQLHNLNVVMHNIDKFVRLRRYETFSLHEVYQNLRISDISWLCANQDIQSSALSRTDFAKRKEIISELLYYLFDSFIIPLIHGHFHVTESAVQRNQLFYFRHDVWKHISEPTLTSLKVHMLEECDSKEVKRMLANRKLGVGQVRLVPKETGMRPIINLRRKVLVHQQGGAFLGKSINSVLTPAFSILNYEKTTNPSMLASALFSADEMYPRLQRYRCQLESYGVRSRPLYFAKVDVRSCFDTIPQTQLMQLVRRIPKADSYEIFKYARTKLINSHNKKTPGFGTKPSWRFLTKAVAANGHGFNFENEIKSDTAHGRNRTVFVDGGVHKIEDRKSMLDLLEEHVKGNLIKLDNRFYKQKVGIPQGSVVSSLLCSYFYAEMERTVLGPITQDCQTLLLRLVDDFLVISTKKSIAESFMQTMHAGVPFFGVTVKPEKSRTNFDLCINGMAITNLPAITNFPFCGNTINTVSLDLSKDRHHRRKTAVMDSVSIEHCKLPGQTFYRKIMTALKLQMRKMFLSTKFNSSSTVLTNINYCFVEVAQKAYYYIRSLPKSKQPSDKLLIKVLEDLIQLACGLIKRRKHDFKDKVPFECSIKDAEARWLAYSAFQQIFQKRQSKHKQLLDWIRGRLARTNLKMLDHALHSSAMVS